MSHIPVLLEEVVDNLSPEVGDLIVDATLGEGGHSREILNRIVPGGHLIAIDKDEAVIERARERLRQFDGKFTCVKGDFRHIGDILKAQGVDEIDGALFDLGMSSFQLDDPERGFSFLQDGPLDMQFGADSGISATEIVNKYGQERLADIIKNFGDERHAKLIAKTICSERKKKKISTTKELSYIITRAVGKKYRTQKLHPAARTFQAIRICANDELEAAEEGIVEAVEYLKPGGRVCVISFNSLEDRIVKNLFRERKKEGILKIITKKPLVPSTDEIRSNPRARSAKLRVAERI